MADMSYNTIRAIDYGDKRIGLAKSDPTGMIASALDTIEVKSFDDAVKKVSIQIETYNPAEIVIGYPLLASGDKSAKCIQVDKFIDRIAESYKKPIHKVDESWSSEEAKDVIHAHGKKVGKKKERVDKLAAAIILQRFLDGH
jgi:putative Holliday junction resolvase